jgi:hypothetical protein
MSVPTRIADNDDAAENSATAVTNERRLSAIRPIVRRGLSRLEAAIYIGVGVTKFDALVAAGLMPRPKRIATLGVFGIS